MATIYKDIKGDGELFLFEHFEEDVFSENEVWHIGGTINKKNEIKINHRNKLPVKGDIFMFIDLLIESLHQDGYKVGNTLAFHVLLGPIDDVNVAEAWNEYKQSLGSD